MKSLFIKFILPVAVVTSVGYVKLNNTQTNEVAEAISEEQNIIPSTRSVASIRPSEVKMKGLPVLNIDLTQENRNKINGSWTVFNFKDASDRDEAMNMKVTLELLSDSKVKINNDNDLVYRVTFITNTTIALIKKIDNSYEILELKKDIVVKTNSTEQVDRPKSNLPNGTFNLATVVDGKLAQKPIVGNEISGSLTIQDGIVSGFDASIMTGSTKEKSYSFDQAEVNGIGAFEIKKFNDEGAEEIHSGLVRQQSHNEVVVNFTTGPLSGSTLVFRNISMESTLELPTGEVVDQDSQAQQQNNTPDNSTTTGFNQ